MVQGSLEIVVRFLIQYIAIMKRDVLNMSGVIFPLAKEMFWVDISLPTDTDRSRESIAATVPPKYVPV